MLPGQPAPLLFAARLLLKNSYSEYAKYLSMSNYSKYEQTPQLRKLKSSEKYII